jgi:glycosyltransferase involved in cell wall biosynthesis
MASVTLMLRAKAEGEQSGLLRYTWLLEKLLHEHGTDVSKVYLSLKMKNGYKNNMINGIKTLVQLINIDKKGRVFHATDEFFGLFMPFVKGKKIVTFHHVTKKDSDLKGMKRYLLWRISAKLAIRMSHKVVAVSSLTRDDIIKEYGVRPEKVVVISSMANPVFRTLDHCKRERTVGCVSTFIPRKNILSLIRSFKILLMMEGMSDVKLKLCGDGPEYESIISLINELGIADSVVIMKDLTEEDVVKFYNQISVLATTTMHEGLGLPILEAQKCSAPALILKEARIPEEVSRYAVKCSDERDMALQMFKCISDEEYCNSIIQKAKEYADSFGQDFEEKMLKLYEII